MEELLKANLRAVIDAFSIASPLSASTIWKRAAKDARFMDRISGGASFSAKTYDSVLAWFSANWPEGAVWPDDVARPAPVDAIEAAGNAEPIPAAAVVRAPHAQTEATE